MKPVCCSCVGLQASDRQGVFRPNLPFGLMWNPAHCACCAVLSRCVDEELADAVDDADGDEAQGGTVSVGQLADMFAE